jgi:hypothetical protein
MSDYVDPRTRDGGEVMKLIRTCYGISGKRAEKLLVEHDGDLDRVLDALGESDDSPPVRQMAFDPFTLSKRA